MITPSDIPALMLHVTGRSSGKRRSSPLLYLEGPDGYVVVGTNWGRSSTPEWVLNLEANPGAEVEVRGKTLAVNAEVIGPAAQAPWWERFDALWPGYESYRKEAAHRSIRMFLLRGI
jgi:deazaflavin-dependent oxidoreductase (nitroreductase family)